MADSHPLETLEAAAIDDMLVLKRGSMGKPQKTIILVAGCLVAANGVQRLISYHDWVLGSLSLLLGFVIIGQFYWREWKRERDPAGIAPNVVIDRSGKTGAAQAIHWPWLIFAMVLAGGMIADSLSVHWSAESWLDLATFAVSAIGIVGVLFYALGREYFGAAFWRLFRWVFAGVVTLEVLYHARQVAMQHKYSEGGTVGFMLGVAVVVGWIYVLQWIAMTRLAKER